MGMQSFGEAAPPCQCSIPGEVAFAGERTVALESAQSSSCTAMQRSTGACPLEIFGRPSGGPAIVCVGSCRKAATEHLPVLAVVAMRMYSRDLQLSSALRIVLGHAVRLDAGHHSPCALLGVGGLVIPMLCIMFSVEGPWEPRALFGDMIIPLGSLLGAGKSLASGGPVGGSPHRPETSLLSCMRELLQSFGTD